MLFSVDLFSPTCILLSLLSINKGNISQPPSLTQLGREGIEGFVKENRSAVSIKIRRSGHLGMLLNG